MLGLIIFVREGLPWGVFSCLYVSIGFAQLLVSLKRWDFGPGAGGYWILFWVLLRFGVARVRVGSTRIRVQLCTQLHGRTLARVQFSCVETIGQKLQKIHTS